MSREAVEFFRLSLTFPDEVLQQIRKLDHATQDGEAKRELRAKRISTEILRSDLEQMYYPGS